MRLMPVKRPAKAQEDERWQRALEYEHELHGTWGLGGDETGMGYRARLRRLCDFLGRLQPEPASPPDEASDFARLRRGLAQARPGCGARESYLHRLGDLRQALEALLRADGENDTWYWERLEMWSPGYGLAAARKADLEQTLTALGALSADPARPDDTARGCLQAMSEVLDSLQADAKSDDAKARVDAARVRWQDCLSDCADDWEWAWLQVLVLLARECLRDKPSHPDSCQHARTAKAALEQAIPRLESKGFDQSRAQGLYGILAATCLALGKANDTPQEERLPQIESALVYARHAVAMEPESIGERLVFLDVLAALGDPEDIKVQAEIALDLDSSPETLRTIGGSYWGRAAALRGRRARRRLLREAARFFARALDNVESAPLDERGPLAQIEAHAWAHFWLGRFQGERGRFAEASAHLRTASTLGFKPLEARVELAWTCLLARDRKHADQAFRAAAEEAGRRRAGGAGVAEAPGEERPVAELAFEAHLGWAFLCADWDPDRALVQVKQAEALLPTIARPNQHERRAALLEVRGRAALRRRKLKEALELLEESVKSSPRSGAYCALGFANLALATGAGATAALQRAREAYRLARDCDLRRRCRRELWELRRELRKREMGGLQSSAGAPSLMTKRA
jgi:tetratricopeptide (TPR) repeat protein